MHACDSDVCVYRTRVIVRQVWLDAVEIHASPTQGAWCLIAPGRGIPGEIKKPWFLTGPQTSETPTVLLLKEVK